MFRFHLSLNDNCHQNSEHSPNKMHSIALWGNKVRYKVKIFNKLNALLL